MPKDFFVLFYTVASFPIEVYQYYKLEYKQEGLDLLSPVQDVSMKLCLLGFRIKSPTWSTIYLTVVEFGGILVSTRTLSTPVLDTWCFSDVFPSWILWIYLLIHIRKWSVVLKVFVHSIRLSSLQKGLDLRQTFGILYRSLMCRSFHVRSCSSPTCRCELAKKKVEATRQWLYGHLSAC